MSGDLTMPTEQLLLQQQSEMRDSMKEMAQGINSLSTMLARVEERHEKQNDGLKRLGKQVDDHEARIRVIEQKGNSFIGSWKAMLVVGVAFTTVAGIVVQFATGTG